MKQLNKKLIVFVCICSQIVLGFNVKDVIKINNNGVRSIMYLPIHSINTYRFLPLLVTSIREESNASMGLSSDWAVFLTELHFDNFKPSLFKQTYPQYKNYIFNVGDLIASQDCNFAFNDDINESDQKKMIVSKFYFSQEKGVKYSGHGLICSYYFALNKKLLGDSYERYLADINTLAQQNKLIASPFSELEFVVNNKIDITFNTESLYQDLLTDMESFGRIKLLSKYLHFTYLSIKNGAFNDIIIDDKEMKNQLIAALFKHFYSKENASFTLVPKEILENNFQHELHRNERVSYRLDE